MSFAPIAIVGRGCIVPDAPDPAALWRAVAAGRDLIDRAPAGRWRLDPARALVGADGDRRDRAWHDRGGYVRDFAFDPEGFAVPAAGLAGLDPVYLWTLHAARQALAEAGAVGGPRVAAVFGNLGFPSAGFAALAESHWLGGPAGDPRNRFHGSGPARLLETALDIGAAFCVDAACASALYAIKLGCDRLHDGRADLVVAGAVQAADDLFLHVGFTALEALSPSGRSRPFHADADGLVPAEGAACLALKRLADARRDGDRVLGVIRGVGLSNDGRGKGLLAPSPDGQARAIAAAWRQSGLDPRRCGLLECHATGTSVGDAAELQSSARVFAGHAGLPIGSLKSNLGHLITAAGAAGVLKVLGAFEAGVRPPTLHVDRPNPALGETPFRLLTAAEPWPADDLRVAAVSAFGFGGNNAHLIVSQDDPGIAETAPAPADGSVVVVALGARVGAARERAAFTEAALGERAIEPRIDGVDVDLVGLRFPPADLKQALPQQVAVLAAAREAMGATATPAARTGVFVGMEPDAEVTRYGARWRAADDDRDRLIPALRAPGVVGTMPNMPANRLSSQLDLHGPAFTVSSGAGSGLVALDIAARALRAGELDAALVGAVDFGCETVHRAACAAVGAPEPTGDAAVVLVLKRRADAERDGDGIYGALVDGPDGQMLGESDAGRALDARLGHATAAAGLVHAAAGLVGLAHRVAPGGDPLIEPTPTIGVQITGAPPMTFAAVEGRAPRHRRPPRIHTWAAADRAALLAAVRAGEPGGQGPARLAIVADDAQFADRTARAIAHLRDGGPAGPGVHVRMAPVAGQVAWVFAGAGAAYRGMGRDVLAALPGLGAVVRQSSARLLPGLGRFWGAGEGPGTTLEQLWGSSALCQLHAALSRDVLGLRPDAALGYSSGETNALLATGVWRDIDGLVADSEACGLFERDLSGRFEAVGGAWACWAVRAPLEVVRDALAGHSSVHLAIEHGPDDGVIAGRPEACAAVVERLGPNRCRQLDYTVAVHVPELAAVRDRWLDLHRRPTHPTPVRIYGNAHHGAYTPGSEACARAILEQADRPLVLPPTIEAAWADGVRIFVEHGPQSHCTRWIRRIIGERDGLAVAYDQRGRGVEATLDAVAALWSAGVDVDLQRLDAALGRAPEAPPTRSMTLPGHWPAVAPPTSEPPLPAASRPAQAAPAPESTMTVEVMAPAPSLPPSLMASAALAAPPSPSPTAPSSPSAAPPEPAAPAAEPTAPAAEANPVVAAWRRQIEQLAHAHEAFLARQQDVHGRFLAQRADATRVLLSAVSDAGLTGDVAEYAPASAAPAVVPTPPPAVAPAPTPSTLAPVAAPASPERPAAPPRTPAPPKAPAPAVETRAPVGPTFDRDALIVHAGGRISRLFGPAFAAQDARARQVRMPLPPLLLADRVVGIDAEPASMGTGTIWTETDVTRDAWYLHQGHMPPGVLIESGQADLMLISYLGVDLNVPADRVYRLLGCTLRYHGDLPRFDETLRFDIHIDGHAAHGDVRLFFFHYDCQNGDRPQLSVRDGQAGFFTDAELAESAGCLWTPAEQEIVAKPRLDRPTVRCTRTAFDAEQVAAFAAGETHACFGPGFEKARSHVRSPRIQGGRMQLFDRVTDLAIEGGPWGRGYLRAEMTVTPDRWFFDGHFHNDPCMPGTLMFEGCTQAMAFYIAALGYTLDRDGWRFRPVPELDYALQCRGQVTPESRLLVTEVFVEEVVDGPHPTLYADLLCTVDGLKAFHARRVAIELVPAWPLDARPELLEIPEHPGPIAEVDGFRFDYASLLACAWGRPSDAFGPMYARFDGPQRVARLPGPPYHFLSRVARVKGEIGVMQAGAEVEVHYDVPESAWYFENSGGVMPYAVLLEAVLQPCGWLASYVGSALTVDGELGFRNLDGKGVVHREIGPGAGTLVTRVKLESVSATGGMIIESFTVDCTLDGAPVYTLETVFGFFPPAALANQAGLAVSAEARAFFDRPVSRARELSAGYGPDRAPLAHGQLLMLDRISGYWPDDGAAGLGLIRGEKDVSPGEWFFRAHFFQDPVQPGSLGLEALLQLLQCAMLEAGLDAGIARPRFQAIATGPEMGWKYRGQVLTHNRRITSTLEVTAVEREADGVVATARGSLWVDGKRIYEADGLAMRIVSGPLADAPGAGPDSVTLDPARDTWIGDHRPTFTVPALPMMSVADLLADGVAPGETVIGLRDVRLRAWLVVDAPRTLTRVREGDVVRLFDGDQQLASARVITGRYAEPPAPLPAIEGEPAPDPYASGALFHGPAFQVLESLVTRPGAASSRLRATAAVPVGRLHPALLDGATHGIPHDALHRWQPDLDPDRVAYPATITALDVFGPPPTAGHVRCEVRFDGLLGEMPTFAIQLIADGRVWAAMRLIEVCLPKGPIGRAEPLLRRGFLRDRQPGPSLSVADGDGTLLDPAVVRASDWLPGTVEAVYGTVDPADIARQEHAARAHGLHPHRIFERLPVTRFDLETAVGDAIRVSGDGRGALDISAVRRFWSAWFDRGPWPVEDLYYGLIERFLGRVVLDDPDGFAAIGDRSALYLANHQTAVESLLFSIVTAGLTRVPTVTLAKIEHRETWLGRLIRHCFAYPGVTDPRVMTFFDRADKASLTGIIGELGAEMAAGKRSVMVHVEGTRSLSCRTPVQKMSGAFIDMALAVGAPIVPVRFVGGLPAAPLDARVEFPIGDGAETGRQDIWFGRPLLPEELAPLHYGERKQRVIDGINRLGPCNADEAPIAGDPTLAAAVADWQKRYGADHPHGTLGAILSEREAITAESRRLLADPPAVDDSPEGRWLAELARRLKPG